MGLTAPQAPPENINDLRNVPMKCEQPTRLNGFIFPCEKCYFCARKRAAILAHRIELEATQYPNGQVTFTTLTYDEDHLPHDLGVHIEDVTLWLKRFRAAIAPRRIRYFYASEYGDLGRRPHYHAIVYGYPACSRIETQFETHGPEKGKRPKCCAACTTLYETWQKGRVQSKHYDVKHSAYLASYLTKGLTETELAGRPKEFARWSRKPGLGVGFAAEIASTLLEYDLHKTLPDVPPALQHGRYMRPLGRYMRGKIREAIGRDKLQPAELRQAYQKTLNENVKIADSFGQGGARAMAWALADMRKAKARTLGK
jgi:hypothetical protein